MVVVTRSPVDSDVEIIHSVYSDNPYLDLAYIQVLEDLATQDEQFFRIYTLGQWGRLEGKIYRNYTIIPELPVMSEAKWVYGLDFGYTSPTAVIKVYLLKDKIYLEECLYKSGLTNADIIEFFSHQLRGDIYGDPTSKQAIKEIEQAGYSAFEGIKSVKESIDLCRRQTLYIPQGSVNLIKEIQNYHWKKNPQAIGSDEDAFLPEPVKYADHACDAMRYAIWGITSRFGFATQRPMATEPIKSLTFRGRGINKILDRWLQRDAH